MDLHTWLCILTGMIKLFGAAFSVKWKATAQTQKISHQRGLPTSHPVLWWTRVGLALTLQRRCCLGYSLEPWGKIQCWTAGPSLAETQAGCQRTWVAAGGSSAGTVRWLARWRMSPRDYQTGRGYAGNADTYAGMSTYTLHFVIHVFKLHVCSPDKCLRLQPPPSLDPSLPHSAGLLK